MPLFLFGGFVLASVLGLRSTAQNFDANDGQAASQPAALPPPPPQSYAPYGGYQMQYAGFGQSVRLRPSANGHYHVQAQIGRQPVLMMVDTGCTGVVIDHVTARAMGIPLNRARYDFPVRAGNTVYYAHRFVIPEIVVEGRLSARSVDAVVHREDGGPNLLGMSFLSRFRVEMAGGELIISEASHG